MSRRLLAVAVVATAMAILGTHLVTRRLTGNTIDSFMSLYVHVTVVSNLLWHFAARVMVWRSLPLWQGLLIGAVSPLIGALGVPFWVPVVLRLYYICFPVGLATGYIVWRVMTSPWRGWSVAA